MQIRILYFGENQNMSNPWEKIKLSDYENHMRLDSVMQLKIMNEIMREQFYDYDVSVAMILGVAGGNGLNHIDTKRFKKVYGVDINDEYLKECISRFPQLKDIFVPIQADLQSDKLTLQKSEIVIANLLIEYIGYESFQRVIFKVCPRYISCVIQENGSSNFVSDSPYRHAFDQLKYIHHKITECDLTLSMQKIRYKFMLRKEYMLPNAKKLLRLDYVLQA